MADYFNHFEPIFDGREDEMDAMLCMLYHDSRDGQIIRTIFFQDRLDDYGNMPVEETCFTKPENITFLNRWNFFTDSRQDGYVSLATFANGAKRRRSDNLYNRSTMYIDIDCHNAAISEEERTRILLDAAEKLNRAYEDGRLPVPTFINHTGRGLACFYVLRRSINAKITETKNTLLAFQSIYAKLVGLYAHVLEACDAQVDTCVTDATRIVRAAGTVNSKNGKICHMVYRQTDETGAVVYVDSLRDFAPYLEKIRTVSPLRSDYSPEVTKRILTRRLSALEQLVGLRKADAESLRHMTLLVIYQTAYALQEETQAVETLYRCNFMYEQPLPESELLNIIASTARVAARTGSVYRFTNKRLISMLGMTEEEIASIHFGETRRMKERRETTQRNQKKRMERNAEIMRLVNTHAMTQKKIAEKFGLSVRGVEDIIRRERAAAKSAASSQDAAGLQETTMPQGIDGLSQEVQKEKEEGKTEAFAPALSQSDAVREALLRYVDLATVLCPVYICVDTATGIGGFKGGLGEALPLGEAQPPEDPPEDGAGKREGRTGSGGG